MHVTDELPPLAIQILRTLKETYDDRGPNAFDEDAAMVFHVIGSVIAQVCGRDRLSEAVETLKADLEGIGEAKGSIH
ncbi:MAG: hypothetical protein JWP51_1014 [Bradyrhizobium sp.]|jgi:hypothetical protein|nr:hypothetical protein [Bradyrhizobium sp.]